MILWYQTYDFIDICTGSGVKRWTGSGVNRWTGSGEKYFTGSGVGWLTGSGEKCLTGSGVGRLVGSGVNRWTGGWTFWTGGWTLWTSGSNLGCGGWGSNLGCAGCTGAGWGWNWGTGACWKVWTGDEVSRYIVGTVEISPSIELRSSPPRMGALKQTSSLIFQLNHTHQVSMKVAQIENTASQTVLRPCAGASSRLVHWLYSRTKTIRTSGIRTLLPFKTCVVHVLL